MNPLLILAAAVVVFLIWRRQQEDQAAQALGWRPANGGADGSPQSQNAAAHGGSPVVGNTQQSPDLESALGYGAGVGTCTALGAGKLAPVCGALGSKVLPALTKTHYILGRGPPTSADTRAWIVAQNQKVTDDYRETMGGLPPDARVTADNVLIVSGQDAAAYGAAIGGKNPFVPPGFGIPKLLPAKGPAVESRSGRGHF